MSESNVTPTVPPQPAAVPPIPAADKPPPAPALTGRYPGRFAELEQQMIDTRRSVWPSPAPNAVITGLALSGGGIRSATFGLGLLQALARRSLLQQFDFLSTVSGGGYIGSFLGAWINREGAPKVQAELPDSNCPPVHFLRENGRYLAPNGSADLMTMTAAHLRNWFAVWIVLGTLVLGAFLGAEAFKVGLRNHAWTESMRRIAERSERRVSAQSAAANPESTRSAGVISPSPTTLATGAPAPAAAASVEKTSFWQGAREHLTVSPFFYVAAWVLLLFGASTATAYWFVGRFKFLWQLWLLLAVVGVALAWILLGPAAGWTIARKGGFVVWYLVTVGLAIAAWASADRPDIGRNWITDRLAAALMVALGVAVFAVIDTVGQSLALDARWWLSAAVLPALAVVAQWLMPRLAEASKKGIPPWMAKVILPVVAALVALVGLGVLSMAAHRIGGAVVFGRATPPREIMASTEAGPIALDALGVGVVAVVVLAVAAALGLQFVFVNASSHHRLYSARIARTYLGASNPWRTDPERQRATAAAAGKGPAMPENIPSGDVTTSLPGDDIEYFKYAPHARGGPLHLINATVNETISGLSHIEQRDRHGLSFAIGPAGLSVRQQDHAEWLRASPPKPQPGHAYLEGGVPSRFHALAVRSGKRIQVELPSLGAWAGISGAAFTTGLGSRTNLAFSFLLGFFNVRLGYWWDSGVKPHLRAGVAPRPAGVRLGDMLSDWFRAQSGLLDEFLARFHGPARLRWYLSDGGHFENTAAYELIRRRIPLIVCCDCGADPQYRHADLANLVLKARLDFGAEIVFWTEDQLAAQFGPNGRMPLKRLNASLGTLPQLAPAGDGRTKGFSPKHAALATITYGDGSQSLLLLVKPTLSADAPTDICHYDTIDSAFPQQTTLDQFFDEAQWESYRKLGDFIGGKLFGDTAGAGGPEWDALVNLALGHARARAPGAVPAAAAGTRLHAVS